MYPSAVNSVQGSGIVFSYDEHQIYLYSTMDAGTVDMGGPVCVGKSASNYIQKCQILT